MAESEQQRFRSFAERYVIARAHNFSADPVQEEHDAWECAVRARSLYEKINNLSHKYAKVDEQSLVGAQAYVPVSPEHALTAAILQQRFGQQAEQLGHVGPGGQTGVAKQYPYEALKHIQALKNLVHGGKR